MSHNELDPALTEFWVGEAHGDLHSWTGGQHPACETRCGIVVPAIRLRRAPRGNPPPNRRDVCCRACLHVMHATVKKVTWRNAERPRSTVERALRDSLGKG